jgi:hypothetical protein
MTTQIIESLQFSTMASNWTEHLCLHQKADGSFRLDVLGWEYWGEDSEFMDDETGEIEVPDEIDGLKVMDIEDGCIVIDKLVPTGNGDASYEFKDFNWEKFVEEFTLEDKRWCADEIRGKIQQSILDFSTS